MKGQRKAPKPDLGSNADKRRAPATKKESEEALTFKSRGKGRTLNTS